MALIHLLQVIGRQCVTKHKSLVAIGERHGWNPDNTAKILRGEVRPTKTQLRTIASELELSVESLRKLMD